MNKIFVAESIAIRSIVELNGFEKEMKKKLGKNWKSWKVTRCRNYLIWFPPKMSKKEFSKQFTEWYNYKLKNWNPFD